MFTTAYSPQGWSRTVAPALLGAVLGCALQLQQSALSDRRIYVCFVLLALSTYALAALKNIAFSRRRLAPLFCIVAGLALGWGSTGLRAADFLSTALNPALEGRDVRVTGVVQGLPQSSEVGLRFTLRVEQAQRDGQAVELPARVAVGWYANGGSTGETVPAAVRAGERWALTLRLKAPHGSMNPHGFDYELWLWEQGIQATAYVRTSAKDLPPERLAQTWLAPVALARQVVRERILERVPDRRVAGLLTALVVGDQAALERNDWDVFRATGVSHLVSISGLHITLFAWGAAALIGFLWRRSGRLSLACPAATAAAWGGLLAACAYAVFSGWGLPAQRTCWMLATVTLLRASGLRWPWPQVWLLACAVVVAVDPWALLQPGFWLSFVAVGVLFASNSGASRAEPMPGEGTFYVKTWQLVCRRLGEQWGITLALAPLTLMVFGQVSVVGLLANVLAIPWVTLVLAPLALLGTVVPPGWDVAAWAAQGLWWWLGWLAQWPGASLSLPRAPMVWGLASMLGAFMLVLPWPWSARWLGLPLLLPVLWWQPEAPAPGAFTLLAPDIGQGNAVLVHTARHALLFDAGPRYSLESDAGNRVLVPLLRALDVQLDTLVLSHRDTDHVGGAPAVLALYPHAALLSSLEPSHPLQSLRASRRCEAGQAWEWDGVRFEVLHPRAEDYAQAAKSNAMSCVLRIAGAHGSALLAGDIEAAQEARLLQSVASGTVLKTDWLLVPHHGSKTSSSEAFVAAVAPSLAMVQAGYRNRFGHPAEPVLARYAQTGVSVLDSPHCGAMLWSSDAPAAWLCSRENQMRYWHHRVP
ncbi:MAG: DNA internalization-related competence protein ComEC/Rec2 [Rhodoferax sp.]|nr:DNA internalization-related competence protein ComEC/Rec2 [Rhodoferax sp.]